MSESKVILVRHAESQHNVDKNFDRLDPALTESGTEAAKSLGIHFPQPQSVGVVLSSPSQRAIQTALAAFPHVLDRRYFDPASGLGVEAGATFLVDPDAQERSALPCDTCSDRESLQRWFPFLDFSLLPGGEGAAWRSNTGFYSEHDDAVKERAARLRRTLGTLLASREQSPRPNVAVFTHGVFMKALTGDDSIDVPRPGWATYHVQMDNTDGTATLVAEK